MREQLYLLVKLQKIETETSDIKAELGQVSKKFEKLDDERHAFEQALADEESDCDELKKNYRNFEADAQTNLSSVDKTEVKLRSVKTNKEYQALLKEIEDQKAKNSKIEDRMLECLDRLDEVEKSIAKKKQDQIELSEQLKSEKGIIAQDVEQKKKKLIELDTARDEIAGMIEPKLLEKYNTTKSQQAGGLAVASVKNAVCYGCNMNIPPQMYNELHRRDALMFCPHCHRILYWDETPTTKNE
jgi:predicted  nucleic acid-binding Zn-ribbon protein